MFDKLQEYLFDLRGYLLLEGALSRAEVAERRFIVYRYGPSWGTFRYGYRPSPELLQRLTPARRKIVQPWEVWPRVPNRKPESVRA